MASKRWDFVQGMRNGKPTIVKRKYKKTRAASSTSSLPNLSAPGSSNLGKREAAFDPIVSPRRVSRRMDLKMDFNDVENNCAENVNCLSRSSGKASCCTCIVLF
jgi:hypothetical protein